jgi:hypothetical protein
VFRAVDFHDGIIGFEREFLLLSVQLLDLNLHRDPTEPEGGGDEMEARKEMDRMIDG